jgi:uncharacterized protein (TIGR02646 family)
MIKVKRPVIPDILKVHHTEWTQTLVDLVNQYGGYDQIPKKERNKIVNEYQHNDIKKAIEKMFHGKCVFCEGFVSAVSYIHIEHFHPKSIYYEETFKWDNLFPACNRCNISKGDHDTKKEPIINPEQDNPEEYFIYPNLRIQSAPKSPDREKSQLTIRVCDLDRLSLSRAMAIILCQFYENEKALKKEVIKCKDLTQNAAKIRHLNKIHDALENMKATSADTESHAGFLRYILRTNPVVKEAIQLINAHKNELGLCSDFELY